MGRLDGPLLERTEVFIDRCLNVCEQLERGGVSRRIVDQLTGSSTAVGANLFEADEALSRKDFAKTVAIAIKELNETRFWLRLLVRRTWIPQDRLTELNAEASELKSILGAILSRTRQHGV